MIASPTLFDRTGAALRALASPLGHETLEDWFAAAADPVKQLFGAEHISLLSWRPEAPLPYSDLDPAARTAYAEAYGEKDPFRELMVRSGREVGHPWMATRRDELLRTEFYNDFLAPHRLGSALALTARGREGQWHVLSLAFRRLVDEDVLENDLELLRLLAPAFGAGLDAWSAFHGFRGRLGSALDEVAAGCALYALTGRVLHANAALERMLASEPDAEAVRAALEEVARAGAVAGAAGGPAAEALVKDVRTARARYRLRGSWVPEGVLATRPLVMVTVEDRSRKPLSDAELRERYGLTKRETVVARLVAEGLSNPQIARRLWISPYTARNHVERLLQKLEAGSRTRVAALLGGAPE